MFRIAASPPFWLPAVVPVTCCARHQGSPSQSKSVQVIPSQLQLRFISKLVLATRLCPHRLLCATPGRAESFQTGKVSCRFASSKQWSLCSASQVAAVAARRPPPDPRRHTSPPRLFFAVCAPEGGEGFRRRSRRGRGTRPWDTGLVAAEPPP